MSFKNIGILTVKVLPVFDIKMFLFVLVLKVILLCKSILQNSKSSLFEFSNKCGIRKGSEIALASVQPNMG